MPAEERIEALAPRAGREPAQIVLGERRLGAREGELRPRTIGEPDEPRAGRALRAATTRAAAARQRRPSIAASPFGSTNHDVCERGRREARLVARDDAALEREQLLHVHDARLGDADAPPSTSRHADSASRGATGAVAEASAGVVESAAIAAASVSMVGCVNSWLGVNATIRAASPARRA